MTSTNNSATIYSTPTDGTGLEITHIVERDGFGGEETEADVDAYCEAVANAIAAVYPKASVTVETGLSRRTEIAGDASEALDGMEVDAIRQACRDCAASVWEAGDFWTGTDVTDEQIRALGVEAGEHGDMEQVALCRAALGGDVAARTACERVIRDARAQADT